MPALFTRMSRCPNWGGDGSDGGVVVSVNGEVADVKTFGLESRSHFYCVYLVASTD